MTAWIAIALWLVPLIGQVQARPVSSEDRLIMEDLGFELLEEVLCTDDINFTSPTNVMVKCHGAALELFINEFRKVQNVCVDKDDRANQTMEELERVNTTYCQHVPCVPQTQAECTLTMKVHKNFADFVNATKVFAQNFNSAQNQTKKAQGQATVVISS